MVLLVYYASETKQAVGLGLEAISLLCRLPCFEAMAWLGLAWVAESPV